MSVLKEYTDAKHREAEDTPFVQYMLHGNISVPDYVQYLQQMHAVYVAIETYAERVGLLTDFPDIKRAQYMAEDLSELGYTSQFTLMPAIQRWCDHIADLYESGQGDLIMAHVYVRHMGDMYGGKAIAKRVPGAGRAYGFQDRPALIKAFDAKLHVGLVEEALKAFDLAIDFFHELQEKIDREPRT